ncbi:hypothetical protein GCM10007425_11340 [Lysinibacillus alkalisoli]|uniref:VanZ-like domain-containing protein n=1 Tax=Lysinibacillus alkalisoli TaxID=1911548 RepID=A0A917G2H0_9BACI|nr:VanZ family protein [Lysinibacillus alkalisoli]GGG18575.1 hypothetical protein GCM10007425_11340 [Lysinibacillus alkalisoli]
MKKLLLEVQNIILILLFSLYLFALITVVFVRYPLTPEHLFTLTSAERVVNIVPFHTITHYLNGIYRVTTADAWLNVFGNILLFIPLGMMLMLRLKSKRMTVFYVVMASVSIEVVQYLLNIGATDIDDVILNVTGGVMGAFSIAILLRFAGEFLTKLILCIGGMSMVALYFNMS